MFWIVSLYHNYKQTLIHTTMKTYTTSKQIDKARNIELITGAIFFAFLLAALIGLISLIPVQ